MRTLIPLIASALLATTAHAELSDGLIFQYDEDPGSDTGFSVYAGKQIGSVSAYDLGESTFSLRLKIDAFSDNWASFFHVGNTSQERYPALFTYPNSSMMAYRYRSDSNLDDNIDGTYLPMHEWVRVTGVFTQNTASFYFNDALQAQVNDTFSWVSSTAGQQWAVWAGDPWHNNMTAQMDDVRIYNRALTQEEITTLSALSMTGGSGPSDVASPLSGVAALGLFALLGIRRKRA